MAAKSDPRIAVYIAKSAPFARPILKHLRKLVHAGCPRVGETIKWGFPNFIYQGKILCGMAAFKAHLGFGFWHQGMEKLLEKEFGRTMEALGLMGRITSRGDLPDDRTMRRLIKAAVKFHDSGAPARLRPRPKPALPLPADLATALKKNKKATAAWAAFSPSCRREYIEWITDAKRPETRAVRLTTTITWTAAGKKRNWKYKNC